MQKLLLQLLLNCTDSFIRGFLWLCGSLGDFDSSAVARRLRTRYRTWPWNIVIVRARSTSGGFIELSHAVQETRCFCLENETMAARRT